MSGGAAATLGRDPRVLATWRLRHPAGTSGTSRRDEPQAVTSRAQDARRRLMARRVGGRAVPPEPLSASKCPFLPVRIPAAPPLFLSVALSPPHSPAPLLPLSLGSSPSLPSSCLPFPGFCCLRPTLGLGVGHLTRLPDKGEQGRDGSPESREGCSRTWQEVKTPFSGFMMSSREQVNSLQDASRS